MGYEKKQQVLILCTENSCRSQMAEAMINAKLADTWKAYSAGTTPAGSVHPTALIALNEIGIDHQGQPKQINDLPIKEFDLVITVCGDADENCPLWLRKGNLVHIGIHDPSEATGSQDQILLAFRTARDAIEAHILKYLENFKLDQ